MEKNNQEVELRVIIERGDKKIIEQDLINIGAIKKETIEIADSYFCPEKVKSFSECEMNEVGSFSLRIRETKVGEKQETELNMKVITNRGDHHSWEEHEVLVDSKEEMKDILELTGNKCFIEIIKTRTKYEFGDTTINIEDIKDFGLGIELETITNKENSEKAKIAQKSILKMLNISEDKIVPKSITNIIMKTKSKF